MKGAMNAQVLGLFQELHCLSVGEMFGSQPILMLNGIGLNP